MSPVLPIVSVSMAESLKKLGFSDMTPFCYNDGDLIEYQEDLLLAPSLQEVQAWIGRRKRMDVLVYREVFFNEVGKFFFVREGLHFLSDRQIKTVIVVTFAPIWHL